MRAHRRERERPHPPERVWAPIQDGARWTAYAPMVRCVAVSSPDAAQGKGA
jgi:hypothetical protein